MLIGIENCLLVDEFKCITILRTKWRIKNNEWLFIFGYFHKDCTRKKQQGVAVTYCSWIRFDELRCAPFDFPTRN